MSAFLPESWSHAPLGTLADFEMGQAPAGSDCNRDGHGTPFVKAGEFGPERPIIREWTTNPLKFAQETDVLICVVGATAGKLNLGIDCAIGRSAAAIRPSHGLEQRYLHRFLTTIVQDLRNASTGSAQGVISKDALAKIEIPVAPLPEQRRIVAKLDRLSARSRAARDHLARTAKLAARAKQAILTAAFRGELTADWRDAVGPLRTLGNPEQIGGRARALYTLPEPWTWSSVCSVSAVSGGLTKNPSRGKLVSTAPYLRVANVYANVLRLEDIAEIGCTSTEIAQKALRPGDLLVIEGNGSLDQIGRVAIWQGEIEGCLHQNHIIRVRPGARLVAPYGLYWLLSPAGRSAIETVASSSSGLHTLSISKVKGLPVPLCTLDEQREIVRRIEAAFARIDRLTAEAARAGHLLDRLDDRLLAKAFRGELVPQDPADEPAEALLARIRAARAEVPARRRRKRPKAED